MKNTRINIFIIIFIFIILLTACSKASTTKMTDEELLVSSWESIVSEAKGQTVYWYMWGGSDAINDFVDQKYGTMLKEKYEINLIRVPIANTVEAITKVLNEKQAGKDEGGSVDLIWINGENFATLKNANALFGPFAEKLPNSFHVDYDNPAISKDWGLDIDGYESVWGSAQFQFVYDSNRIQESDLPQSYMELKAWIKENPGRFTYNAPPDFIGTRFIKQLLMEINPNFDVWRQDFDQDEFDRETGMVWDYLNEIKPYLWREGVTYPRDIAELITMFNNNEVDFAFSQDIGGLATEIERSRMPETARPYVFETGTIGDYHYVAIPYNASHKAAALVTANLILEPELQFAKADSSSGWGDGIGITSERLEGSDLVLYEQLLQNHGETAIPLDILNKYKLPDMSAPYSLAIDEGWRQHVLLKK